MTSTYSDVSLQVILVHLDFLGSEDLWVSMDHQGQVDLTELKVIFCLIHVFYQLT